MEDEGNFGCEGFDEREKVWVGYGWRDGRGGREEKGTVWDREESGKGVDD